MNAPRRRGGNRNRSSRPNRSPAADLWRTVPVPDAPEPIRRPADPAALIKSLGSPPLRGHATTAEHYLSAVVERASALAIALAASAGVLAESDDD